MPPILSRDGQALERVPKLAMKFSKGLLYVPYETARQRLGLFSLVRRRICGDPICMHKIMHGLLGFPSETVVAAPTRIWLRGDSLKIHQQWCKTRLHQHTFSVRVFCSSLMSLEHNSTMMTKFKGLALKELHLLEAQLLHLAIGFISSSQSCLEEKPILPSYAR